jgi:hypothetical protein
MNENRKTFLFVPTVLRLVFALIVSISGWALLPVSAADNAGSVTARKYLCPDGLTLSQVQQATNPGVLLADCDPFEFSSSFPQLRAAPSGTPTSGSVFAPGVLLWSPLAFGTYDFGGGNAPSGFGGLLVTTGAAVPVADQQNAPVTISSALPHVERRFYFFAPEGPDVGSIVLTLYRCPTADDLSTTACTLLSDPPIDVAGIFQPGFPEANLAGFINGQAAWHDIPLGTYTIGYGGLVGTGEMAAIPELACVSPSECGVTIGPAAPVADLELFVFPVP